MGSPAAKFTTPSMTALVVSVVMTQFWAMTCIHVPVIDTASPAR